jgi:hypothetical protein
MSNVVNLKGRLTVRKWDGKPITKPGWVSGIPIERYHSAGLCDGPSVSSSNLRTCWSKSAKHMFAQWCENPDAEPREVTRNMILGSAAHHLLLGEDGFKLKFVAQPETYRDVKTAVEKPWTYQANVCKEWRAKQEDAGKTVVTVKELKSVVQMAKSLALEPLVNDGLLTGHIECSGFWKDEETGLWIKVRPDVIPPTDDTYVDLKTAAEVTTPALQSSIRSYGYMQQGALIGEVCENLNLPFAAFMLMFIETSSPYCARTVPLVPEDLGRGRQMNRSALREIKRSIEAGHWMGPGEGELHELGISTDERGRIDARLKAEGLA